MVSIAPAGRFFPSSPDPTACGVCTLYRRTWKAGGPRQPPREFDEARANSRRLRGLSLVNSPSEPHTLALVAALRMLAEGETADELA